MQSVRMSSRMSSRAMTLKTFSNPPRKSRLLLATSKRFISTGLFSRPKDKIDFRKKSGKELALLRGDVAAAADEENAVPAAPLRSAKPPSATVAPIVYSLLTTKDDTIYSLKQLACTTSVAVVFYSPLIWYWTRHYAPDDKLFLWSGLVVLFFGVPRLAHVIVKNHVVDLSFDEDAKIFEASTYAWSWTSLGNRKKNKLQFSQSDVTFPSMPRPFTTIYAKGQPLYFTPDGWKSSLAQKRLMNFDETDLDENPKS